MVAALPCVEIFHLFPRIKKSRVTRSDRCLPPSPSSRFEATRECGWFRMTIVLSPHGLGKPMGRNVNPVTKPPGVRVCNIADVAGEIISEDALFVRQLWGS